MPEMEKQVSSTIESAVTRLQRALNTLEVSVQRRMDADRNLNAMQGDLQRLGEDRSQLAAGLDKAEARAARLEEANKDVSRRLVSAMESIRTVLNAHGG